MRRCTMSSSEASVTERAGSDYDQAATVRDATMPLTHYKVLSLGCYGTLIDRDTGICAALRPLLASARLSLPREEMLAAFNRHVAPPCPEEPGRSFPDTLAEAHRRLAADWGAMCSDDDHALFARSVA